MLLILEIYLTIKAWRRGWRTRALLPIVVGFIGAFLLGLILSLSGSELTTLYTIGFFFDLVITVILWRMAQRDPFVPVL